MLKELKNSMGKTRYYSAISAGIAPSLRFFFHAERQPSLVGTFRWGDMPFMSRWKDWVAIDEIIYQHEYDFIAPLLNGLESPLVLDLGANIGLFSLVTFRYASKAEVHAIEASGDTFQVLAGNSRLNADKNWKTYRFAVWEEDGEVQFEDREASTASRVGSGEMGQVKVPAISFPTLMDQIAQGRRVNLLKIDIEGAEISSMAGQESLLSQVDHTIIELHPNVGNVDGVVSTLERAYPNLYSISDRLSKKPLLLATHSVQPLPSYSSIPA
jgi:FkbM family methyltransferase